MRKDVRANNMKKDVKKIIMRKELGLKKRK